VAIERIPEGARTPSVARAAVSPSAVIATGAGVAVGLVVGLPVVGAVVLGAACWGVRMALAAASSSRRRRAAQPEPIDPYSVPEPWRGFVQQALTARVRFAEAAGRTPPGPLHDRLGEVSTKMGDGVRECWRVAHLGASLASALAALDPDGTSRQLRRLQDGRTRPGPATSGAGSAERMAGDQTAVDQTEAALAARLQAARRMEAVVQHTTDRLSILTAQLGEAVAAAVELSIDAGDETAAVPIAGSVDAIVGEMRALRQATEEAEGSATTGSSPTS
jgi:hypothetical protein